VKLPISYVFSLIAVLSSFLVVETTFHTLEIDVADLSQFLSLVFI